MRPGAQALFLLTASVVTGVLFKLPESLANTIGILGLTAVLFVVLPRYHEVSLWNRRRIATANSALVLAGAATLLLLPTGPAQALALAAVLLAAHVVRVKLHRPDPWLPAASLGLLLLSVLLVLAQTYVWMEYALGRTAVTISSVASAMGGRAVALGASHAGLYLTAFMVLYVCAIARFSVSLSPVRTAAKTMAICVALVVIEVGYVAVWPWIAGDRATQMTVLLQPFADGYDFGLLLFLLLLLPVSVYRPALRDDAASGLFTRRGMRVAIPLAAVLAVSVALVGFAGFSTIPNKNVLIYDSIPGETPPDVPRFGSYTLQNTGMFGLLPDYLRSLGYQVRVTKKLTRADLDWAGTLATFNLRSTLDTSTTADVRTFIEQGGSLLLAGDHTGREEIREPSNALLAPYGITLNFDSAVPFRDAWFNGASTRPHPTLSVTGADDTFVVIGASLTVAPPARTIVMGRDGFSDPGVAQNRAGGFLGNLKWDRGERVGDVPLVAESSAGSGRVLVFGDTTTFQNVPLPHSYAFVDEVFSWLSAAPDANAGRSIQLVALLALIASTIAVYALATSSTVVIALPTGALLVGLVTAGALAGFFQPPGETPPTPISPYAVVDMSHFEQPARWRSPDSVDGLTVNLQRNGYVCLMMPEFDAELVRGASVVVVPTPLEPFTPTELAALDDCAEAGGQVIVTTGLERPAGSYGLLGHYGFGLGTAPLGQVMTNWEGQNLHLWSGWPVETIESSGAETLASAWDYPVAVYRPIGEGGVLVVGDASFFANKNLEDNYTFSEPNILFLRKFLRQYAREQKPDA